MVVPAAVVRTVVDSTLAVVAGTIVVNTVDGADVVVTRIDRNKEDILSFAL